MCSLKDLAQHSGLEDLHLSGMSVQPLKQRPIPSPLVENMFTN